MIESIIIQNIQIIFFLCVLKQYMNLYLSVSRQKILLLSGVLYLIIKMLVVIFDVQMHPILNILYNVSLLFLCTFFSFKGKLYKKIIYVVIFEMLWLIVELISGYMISLFIKGDNKGFYITSISMILLFTVVQLIVSNVKNSNKHRDISQKYRILLLGVPLISMIMAVVIYYFSEQLGDSVYMVIISSVSTGLLLLLNISLFIIYDRLMEDMRIHKVNMLYHNQLEIFEKQAEEREDAILNVINLRHDIKNHLIYIRELIDMNDRGEVITYLDKLLKLTLYQKSEFSRSGNVVLDSLINYKYTKVKQYNIDFQLHITVPITLPYEDGDLLIILGNTLDNAIEAVVKIPKNERWIMISIHTQKNALAIIVRNAYNGDLRKGKNNQLLTSKKDHIHHGIGLSSIYKAVEKYMGSIDINYTDKEFKISILLFKPE